MRTLDKTRRWRFTAIALVTALMFVAVAGYALAFTTSEEDEILWHIRNTAHNFWKFWTEDSPGNFPHEVAAIKDALDAIDADLDGPAWSDFYNTRLPDLETALNEIEAKLDGKPDIKHVTKSSVNIDGFFQWLISCDENYQVKAVYAIVDDPDGDIDIVYHNVFASGNFAGVGQILGWRVDHVDFDPPAGGGPGGSLDPYELLSHLQVEQPVGVPAVGLPVGGGLGISGSVQFSSDSSDDTISVGAVVEIAQKGTCNLTIGG